MNARKDVVLLIGSPRNPSNSESLGHYLVEQLAQGGWNAGVARVLHLLKHEDQFRTFLASVAQARVVVLCTPLYADGPPAAVLKLFEKLAEARAELGGASPRFVPIFNCGFPEALHNDVALEICELFAQEMGWRWSGGLAMGMGEALGRSPLAERGGMTRGIRQGLELAAQALLKDEAIPPEAVALLRKSLIPRWLYLLGGNWGWIMQARKFGLKRSRLHDRP